MSPKELIATDLLLQWGVAAIGAVGILVLGWLVAGWLGKLTRTAAQRARVDIALSGFLSTIVRYVVLFAALVAAAGSVGIDTTSLVALLGTAGLAVGLALQGNLTNLASGVLILFLRPFTLGDLITTAGKTARVVEIGLFTTTLQQADNTLVTVPNGQVTGGVIENHTRLGRRRCTVDVGVEYGADLLQVREALERAVKDIPEILPAEDDPGWSVVFLSFGASSLDWQIHAFSKPEHWWPLQEKIKANVYAELEAAGIGIPFPQMDVHFDKAALAAAASGPSAV